MVLSSMTYGGELNKIAPFCLIMLGRKYFVI